VHSPRAATLPARARALLGAALLGPALAGCASLRPLRPFAEVRRELPAQRFVQVDGRPVYVEQQGAGETVVLLHGFGESSYCWRRVIPELARSFRVVAPDLNGFGWTERPRDPQSYTLEGQERLVLGVLKALGITRAHFVGHSYGGSLTLLLASRHPETVRAMVLIDSAAPTYSVDRRSRLAGLRSLDSLLVRFALRPGRVRGSLLESVHDPALVTPELVQAYLDRLRVEGADDAYYGLTARLPRPAVKAAAAAGGGEVKLEKIAVPALVVWGAEDRVIRAEIGRRAAALLPAGEFVTLPRTGHLPMEERPAELLDLMVPFLRRHAEDAVKAGAAAGADSAGAAGMRPGRARIPRGAG
jgi:pimeloyl-ACP methyl ester carboxylesterase